MTITYDDIRHRLQPPLDCSEIKDLRGLYFYNRLITNYENTDFIGCVLYHCYPSGFANAIEVNSAQSEEDVTLQGANLQGAMLIYADLRWAKLQGADLGHSDLENANFQEANLVGANLREAYLRSADLAGSKYNDKTNFEGSGITQEQLDSMIFIEDPYAEW